MPESNFKKVLIKVLSFEVVVIALLALLQFRYGS
jgi:hypothetical protein